MLSNIYIPNPSFVSRRIGTEAVVVPVHERTAQLAHIYVLNDVAAIAWELFDGRRTLADIRDEIIAQFKVDRTTATNDLQELVESLLSLGMLDIKEET